MYGCSADRKSVSQCNMALFTSSLPPEYQVGLLQIRGLLTLKVTKLVLQYFDSGENFDIHDTKVSAIGGDIQIADFCPYQRVGVV